MPTAPAKSASAPTRPAGAWRYALPCGSRNSGWRRCASRSSAAVSPSPPAPRPRNWPPGERWPTPAAIGPERIAARLDGLPAERTYCAELAAEALQAALASAGNAGRAARAVTHHLSGEAHGPRVLRPIRFTAGCSPPAPPPASPPQSATSSPACSPSPSPSPTPCRRPRPRRVGAGRTAATLLSRLRPRDPGSGAASRSGAAGSQSRGAGHPALPPAAGDDPAPGWLAQAIAARAAHPGHLWVAMGLFERPELPPPSAVCCRRWPPPTARGCAGNVFSSARSASCMARRCARLPIAGDAATTRSASPAKPETRQAPGQVGGNLPACHHPPAGAAAHAGRTAPRRHHRGSMDGETTAGLGNVPLMPSSALSVPSFRSSKACTRPVEDRQAVAAGRRAAP